MVAGGVVHEGVFGDGKDVVLQLLEVVHAHYLGTGAGVAEHEIAETEVLLYAVAQVDVHLLGVLVHEACAHLGSPPTVVALARLHDEG